MPCTQLPWGFPAWSSAPVGQEAGAGPEAAALGGRKEGRTDRHSKGGKGQAGKGLVGGEGRSSARPSGCPQE